MVSRGDSDPLSPKIPASGRTFQEKASRDEQDKVNRIIDACTKHCDLDQLRALSTSTGGLINDHIRQIAWPMLLGCEGRAAEADDCVQSWRDLPPHKDEHQVEIDVNRSFIYYPRNESEMQIDLRKQELSSVITQVLREHPMLSYFQGFHDIVQVFLLVLGVDYAPEAVARLSLLRIRDFMLPSLSASMAHLKLLPSILNAEDQKLCLHLSQTQPFFALAATLTLYAHDIQEYGDIARLFDFLIAQPAVVSLYLFAVIILSRRDELFEIPADEPEMLHSTLSKLPKPLNLEELLSQTVMLFNGHPPEKLPRRAWAKISCHSVLKTTYGSCRNQTLKDGEVLFEMQALELRREELRNKVLTRIWKYRRRVSGLGIAVFVGVISFWLGKKGLDFPSSGIQRMREILQSFRWK
ncbi:hypothetical protein N7G274_009205 [Stereocaulon virgatum]|uniref:Rab-GAP TBC domain-containing protein n=1 Tax=Stereocaulon virgatum TaxID=373712 RepID=A0ABR3ZZ57_9LECA